MNSNIGQTQVDRAHYFSGQYLDKSRFLGLHAQFSTINKIEINESILEIGPGPGLFSSIMRNFGKNITTTDFDRELRPDLVAALPYLPFTNNSYDLVCAFEVLEHLPFDLIGSCLSEMARIANAYVVFSVPNIKHMNPDIKIVADLKIGKWKFNRSFFRTKHKGLCNTVEHYWELGFNGYKLEKVVDIASATGLKLVTTNFFDPWFQFFTFKK